MEELLARPKYPVLVKGTPLLEYLDPMQETVSKTFETESDLLLVLRVANDWTMRLRDWGKGGFATKSCARTFM